MSLSDHDVIENELLTYFSKVREGCGNKRSLKPLIGNKVKVKGGCTGMMRAEQSRALETGTMFPNCLFNWPIYSSPQ